MEAMLHAGHELAGELVSAAPSAVARADADADIVALAAAGDTAGALRRLMQRHGAAVYRYCREALRDAALADDVHQQVFLGAFHDLPRFRRRSTVRTWLFAIAHHRVLDTIKRLGRAQAHITDAELTEIPDPGPSPADSIDDARLRKALIASLDTLHESLRIPVLLRYHQGFSFDEIAVICGEKPATLRARVLRALPVLRASIESHLRPRRHGFTAAPGA
jgi:RNA polymerase sigma-70 factor (ECF subfamily)